MPYKPKTYLQRLKDSIPQPPRQFRLKQNDTRPNFRQRGYGTDWDNIRKAYAQANPLCEWCKKRGIVKPVEIVDHIKPLAEGGTHHENNLQSLCRRHHGLKTYNDKRRKQKP